jgi:prepilin-type N-terminal cleavage/methylation domain-containing protein
MKKSGFTLIELIFVIVIIGLLAVVAMPKFLTTKKNSETANLPEIGHQITTYANEQYYLTKENNLSKITDDEDIKHLETDFQTPFKITKDYEEYNITYNDNLCLRVLRDTKVVKINETDEALSYVFRIADLNKSCNQD